MSAGAGLTIAVNLSNPPRNMNGRTEHDPHEKVAAAAACFWQALASDANDFASRNPWRYDNGKHAIGRTLDSFNASFGHAIERYAQIAAQIGSARLEVVVRQWLYAHVHDSAGGSFVSCHPET